MQTTLIHREEAEILEALGRRRPDWLDPFRQELPAARLTACQRLAQALQLEELGHPPTLMPAHPDQMLRGLAGYSNEGLERLAAELRQSVVNLALARVFRRFRQQAFGQRNAVEWAAARSLDDSSFATSTFFEQWVFEGHPLHPVAKLRKHMPADGWFDWSPEAEAVVRLPLLSIAPSHFRETGAGLTRCLVEAYPELAPLAGRRALLAIHPHQLSELGKRYQRWLEDGSVQRIDGPGLAVRPLMSFRSMAPMDSLTRPHLKTAVDIQLTGAIRTVSPNAAENGPMLTLLLQQISAREDHFGGRLVILKEEAAGYFDPPEAGPDRFALQKSLSLLLRQNSESQVARGQVAMPAAALIEAAPSGRGLVLDDLLAVYPASPARFFQDYCQVLVEPLLRLLTLYGVSLEAHLQNCVMVFEGGRPVRMLYRDFGGVRVAPARLERLGLDTHFHPNSATLAEDPRELRNKLFYPLLINHLGQLAQALTRQGHGSERTWWSQLARQVESWAPDLMRSPWGPGDLAALLGPTLDYKRMTFMRLQEMVVDYSYTKVPNPLAR
ncbi:MAG: IucA/IucC family siderophore biosynthesis protein [Vulcanimicrobiota bacterium]